MCVVHAHWRDYWREGRGRGGERHGVPPKRDVVVGWEDNVAVRDGPVVRDHPRPPMGVCRETGLNHNFLW